MQKAYEALGFDAVIIDRYIVPGNRLLLESLAVKGFKARARDLWYSVYGVGRFSKIVRVLKTLRFHKKYLKKTAYSFYDWKDAPKDLGVDFISVGSDQIWNANLYSPVPYLLKDIPLKIPGIAYAASIGMSSLSSQYLEAYKEGFQRFLEIGVREEQAVRLVESVGAKATHVVDPTLLVDRSVWRPFVGTIKTGKRKLLCYTLAEDLFALLPVLEDFAKKQNCDVVLLLDRFERLFPCTLKGVCNFIRLKWRILRSPVKLFLSAGIEDFIREISTATWVVANSYHALMFATIFRKDVRILMPNDKVRKDMHARMAEFSGSVVRGPLMHESLVEALHSIANGDSISYDENVLAQKIAFSRDWLVQSTRRVSEIIESHKRAM